MASKTLLIPVASMAEPDKVNFLELAVEPADGLKPDDALQALGQVGLALQQAAAAALRAWTAFAPPETVKVRLANPVGVNVTNSRGAALGLALSPFLHGPDAPYRVAIVMGGLEFLEDGLLVVSPTDCLAEILRAIQARGYRMEPVLLILPWDGCGEEEEAILLNLAALNIAVRRVNTFAEACWACEGRIERRVRARP